MPKPSRPMRANKGGGLRRRSGRLPPAARSAVASRGAASRGGNGRPRAARAAPPRQGPEVDPSRNQAVPVPRGGGRPRAVAGEPPAPGRRRQAPREPRAILQGPSLGSRLPSSFLLGALRGFRPACGPSAAAGPMRGRSAETTGSTAEPHAPRALRALAARGPRRACSAQKRKPGGFPPGFAFVFWSWLRLRPAALQEHAQAEQAHEGDGGLGEVLLENNT